MINLKKALNKVLATPQYPNQPAEFNKCMDESISGHCASNCGTIWLWDQGPNERLFRSWDNRKQYKNCINRCNCQKCKDEDRCRTENNIPNSEGLILECMAKVPDCTKTPTPDKTPPVNPIGVPG